MPKSRAQQLHHGLDDRHRAPSRAAPLSLGELVPMKQARRLEAESLPWVHIYAGAPTAQVVAEKMAQQKQKQLEEEEKAAKAAADAAIPAF